MNQIYQSLLLIICSIMIPGNIRASEKDTMVNIPFGIIHKEEATNAISVINPNEYLQYDSNQSFESLIIGRIPGLLGRNNIRGIGGAIYIVDGIPRDPSEINVEEIDQVTVLKDANASVFYGTQAANGVILVTTKKGKADERIFNITAEYGLSNPVALPKYLGSADYMTYYNEALVNDGLSSLYSEDLIASNASDATNTYRYPNTDYYSKEFLRKYRPFTKVLTEFSGGNQNTQYYANLGWMNNRSLYIVGDAAKSAINQFNVRGNINTRITDFIGAFIDVSAVFNINKTPVGNFWSDAATLKPHYYAPLLPFSLIKSEVLENDETGLEKARRVNGDYLLGGATMYTNNIYGNQTMGSYNTLVGRMLRFSQGLNFDLNQFVPGLSAKVFVSVDAFNSHNQIVSNGYAVYQPQWDAETDSIAGLTKIGTDVRTGEQSTGGELFNRRVSTYAIINYQHNFNQLHNFSSTLLGYYDKYSQTALLIPRKTAHLALRLAYGYDKKYYVEFSGALVNGYKLQAGKRAGFSPTVGLSWVLSEENFIGSSNMVNFLKLRASAGIINLEPDRDDYRMYTRTFNTDNGSYGWGDGTRSLTTRTMVHGANNSLTFEKMKNINLGIEGYFFNSSLYADVNIFMNKHSGQVIQSTLFPTYFLGAPYENYNETTYKGAEAGLIWSQNFGGFSVELGGNILYATSKITKMDEIHSYPYQYREGKSEHALFALECLGFYTDWQDINNSPLPMFGEVQPGDLKYKDQNNDGMIDSDDAVEIGNSQAKLSYGISILLRYKNFSLFAIGNGRYGAQAYYSGDYFWIQGDAKYSEEMLNRWTPETAQTADYPRLSSSSNSNNFRYSTFWMYDNNFFHIDRVQLTYEMPAKIANILYAKGLSLYIRGNNLLRISKEAEKRQLKVGNEPDYRDYAFGLRLTF